MAKETTVAENYHNMYILIKRCQLLTLVLLNLDMPCLCELFVIKYRYVNLYQQPGSSNLIGWKLEVGRASWYIQHGEG